MLSLRRTAASSSSVLEGDCADFRRGYRRCQDSDGDGPTSPEMTVQNLIKRIQEGFDLLPTTEVPCLTLEALNEACGLLNETLERGDRQILATSSSGQLLETDDCIVD